MATGLSLPTSRIRPSRSAAFGVWGVEQGEPRADAGTSRPEARGRAATVSPIGGENEWAGEECINEAGGGPRGVGPAGVGRRSFPSAVGKGDGSTYDFN